MNEKQIKVGSRSSPLALVQVDEIAAALKQASINIAFDRKTYETGGDIDKVTPLTENVGDDFFTDTLDAALLNHEIDITINSAKDLPKKLRKGLSVFALTKSLDESDAFVGNAKFNELPAGAKVGTSSEIRQKEIKRLRPDVKMVDIRGTIEERIAQVESGDYDGVIIATIALKRLRLERHIKDIMPWECSPMQGQLAVVGRSDDAALKKLFSAIDVRETYGSVSLVGAGPGDPELITVKAIKALGQADCVFYDYLVPKGLLEYAPNAVKIYVGKRKGEHIFPQAELSTMLRKKAMEGKTVVRLKGGDPLVFGRGGEELEYLRSFYINTKVIPGVSSATAIPSSLGVPLTSRGISSSVAFISGHDKGEEKSSSDLIDIPKVDTVVVLMGLSKLNVIVESFKAAGWNDETHTMIVSGGTWPDERIVKGSLKTIVSQVRERQISSPAIIIVGQVTQFLQDSEETKGALLYTGTNLKEYEDVFERVVHLPMIAISKSEIDKESRRELCGKLTQYEIILLTSRFSVKYFFEMLDEENIAVSDLKEKDFIVIGKVTANALKAYGVEPAFISEGETSQELFEEIKGRFDVKDKEILFPRSALPNPYLKEHLIEMGAQVHELTVYDNTKSERRDLPKEGIDKILFTSPSTVKNFLEDYKEIPKGWRILSKGPVTSKVLKDAGYDSEIMR